MSQQDKFAAGFMAGAVFGGLLGGVVGVLAATRMKQGRSRSSLGLDTADDLSAQAIDAATEESMEIARQGLEIKIAQLNEAIDNVRQQLGEANGHTEKSWDNPSMVDS